MRYMLAMFPFVGAVVGLFVWVWLWICGFGLVHHPSGCRSDTLARGSHRRDPSGRVFCDTVRRLSSRASQERKREILKDPHTGAFASSRRRFLSPPVLCPRYGAYDRPHDAPFAGPDVCFSRSLSGLSVLLFPSSAGKGLASTFKESASARVSVIILLFLFLISAGGLIFADTVTGCVMTAAALLCAVYLFIMSRRQVGGMRGALAGFFRQLCGLIMLASIVLLKRWFHSDTLSSAVSPRKTRLCKEEFGYDDTDIADGRLDERPCTV